MQNWKEMNAEAIANHLTEELSGEECPRYGWRENICKILKALLPEEIRENLDYLYGDGYGKCNMWVTYQGQQIFLIEMHKKMIIEDDGRPHYGYRSRKYAFKSFIIYGMNDRTLENEIELAKNRHAASVKADQDQKDNIVQLYKLAMQFFGCTAEQARNLMREADDQYRSLLDRIQG